MKKVGIVICNYNKSEYVVKCIQSVLESNADSYDIYVVDNASVDDSVVRIRTLYGEQVTILQNKENLGGSGGFNRGIRLVVEQGYEYVWCLDNDTLVDENALKALVDFMDEHSEVGMTGSRIYHMENPDYIQQNGMEIDYKNYCVEAKFLNVLEDGTLPEIEYSDAVAACSVLVRTSLVKEIGPLPEENFLYWDDTEWGMRCNAAGYKVATCGSSKVLHAMGAKKEVVNTFTTYYAWRNWIVFFIQHIAEEQLEAMTRTFLHSIFDISYVGLYRNEPNKTKTVMYAYDDAIHHKMGKAPDSYFFDIEQSYDGLKKVVESHDTFLIEMNGYYQLASQVTDKIRSLKPEASIGYYLGNDTPQQAKENMNVTIQEGKIPTGISMIEDHVVSIKLCDYIFKVEDVSLQNVYIDTDLSVFATEEDAMYIINYDYAWQVFLFAQQPLFLQKAKEIRKDIY